MLIDVSKFIYGFTIYAINKKTRKMEFKIVEKPKYGEKIDETLSRIMQEYNITNFIFKNNMYNSSELSKKLQSKGFTLFNYEKEYKEGE